MLIDYRELSRVMKANIANLHDEIGSISKAIRSLQISKDSKKCLLIVCIGLTNFQIKIII